jgi:hypothetical protein
MDNLGETEQQLFRALGQGVIRIWSNLPHDIQQRLFEEASTSHGESIRQQLAVLLHEKHSRTTNPIRARAIPEPDSLGG